jgi:hypothetical protein
MDFSCLFYLFYGPWETDPSPNLDECILISKTIKDYITFLRNPRELLRDKL